MPKPVQKHQRRVSRRTVSKPVVVFLLLFCVLCVLVLKNASVRKANASGDASGNQGAALTDDSGLPVFHPTASANTKPSFFIKDTAINADGEALSSYKADEPIDFGYPSDYTSAAGIVTFRGNNFRDSGAYGSADIVQEIF